MAGWRADFSRRQTVVSRVGSCSIVVNSLIISMDSVGPHSLSNPIEIVLYFCNSVPILRV
jgi:hypothetical protein